MDQRLVLSLGCMGVGGILAFGSLYILLKQKPVVDQTGNVTEIEIPLFGKLKSNYPSLAALLIAAFLVWFPLHIFPTVTRIPVSGKVTFQGKPGNGGVTIGIVPGNLAASHDDGNYEIEVLDGEHTYTGVAYYNGGSMKDIYIGGVSVQGGKGTFNPLLRGEP
jgi:hypothetical protein